MHRNRLLVTAAILASSAAFASAQVTLPTDPTALLPTPMIPPGNLFFDFFLYDNLGQPAEGLGSGAPFRTTAVTPTTVGDLAAITPNRFLEWNVVDATPTNATVGTVDLVGGTVLGADDLADGGRFVDLGGSTNDPARFQSIVSIPFVAGQTYELFFEYRSTDGTANAADVTVAGKTFSVSTSGTAFQTFRTTFVADATTATPVAFLDRGLAGGDGIGIDAVQVDQILLPEPTSLSAIALCGIALQRRGR